MVHQCVVEDHGGRVTLDSEEGEGTRVRLAFPATSGVFRRGERRRTTPTKARLLIVDDEEPQRLMLASLLGRAGFEVDAAPDGGEALELLNEQPMT